MFNVPKRQVLTRCLLDLEEGKGPKRDFSSQDLQRASFTKTLRGSKSTVELVVCLKWLGERNVLERFFQNPSTGRSEDLIPMDRSARALAVFARLSRLVGSKINDISCNDIYRLKYNDYLIILYYILYILMKVKKLDTELRRMGCVGFILSTFNQLQPVLQYYGVIALRSAALVGFSITYSTEVRRL